MLPFLSAAAALFPPPRRSRRRSVLLLRWPSPLLCLTTGPSKTPRTSAKLDERLRRAHTLAHSLPFNASVRPPSSSSSLSRAHTLPPLRLAFFVRSPPPLLKYPNPPHNYSEPVTYTTPYPLPL
ncbi:hypothetical protein Syun_004067 [Stephania yunnanensis]|uniref:Uncharacterized protein n=1 Tax=Stephania yunnanensis TaxID=152371 RepID=A0AAP0Q145_9MAGN